MTAPHGGLDMPAHPTVWHGLSQRLILLLTLEAPGHGKTPIHILAVCFLREIPTRCGTEAMTGRACAPAMQQPRLPRRGHPGNSRAGFPLTGRTITWGYLHNLFFPAPRSASRPGSS